ncbi:ABC transporter ATP-binding protein [Pseudoflavonifractor sp. 60]|uniref:ABC transporter ATP-binding protein n=1 Tax=Pseudoflavonifractor sp. 60 TaxID=2304576 RepID=UPI00136CB36F|nr:ABC transporter ATP-binding protein [Pseudoflavonifractor sp. 60]NBI68649.1 ABC transporter ATP-binding protein [Pseudoflavonifractor sp. 60]
MSVTISIEHAIKKYGNLTVIPDLSVKIANGEFFTLLGPSGCGKTTLLRMIAGFNSIEGGSFRFNDKEINNVEPGKRGIGMVFQNYAIFPNLTVRKNVEFGLKYRNMPKDQMRQEADKFMKLVHVDDYADRMPEQLSGGQQQRIALARALVIEPDVLLMDEPLSNLDAKLRVEMRTIIKRIQHEVGITTVYVTHDQEEAMAISDRIAVMKDGVIHHCGKPENIYQRPADVFVATFIGKTNLITGQMSEEKGQACITVCGSYRLPFHTIRPDAVGHKEVTLSIRPEEFKVWRAGETAEGLKAIVRDSVFLGPNTHYFAQLESGEEVEIIQESEIDSIIQPGSSIVLTINAGKVNVFDKETSLSLMTGVKNSVELPEVGI